MFYPALYAASGVVEVSGIAGAFLTDWPSLPFFFSMRAVEVGLVCLLVLVVAHRRESVEAAFDLGVEVGERRGMRKARPVVVDLNQPTSRTL